MFHPRKGEEHQSSRCEKETIVSRIPQRTHDCLLKQKDPVSQVFTEVLTCSQFCSFVALCFCCLTIFPLGNADKGQQDCKTDEWCDPAIPAVLVYVSLTAIFPVHDLFSHKLPHK